MKIIDTHCDALFKIHQARKVHHQLDMKNASELQTNLTRLKEGNVQVQFFAIFLDPNTPSDEAWKETIGQIEIFQREILQKHSEIRQIMEWQEIHTLQPNEIGAVLTLEGAESIGNDLKKLNQLYEYGVLSIGLTWNKANLCADGVSERRGAGLTKLGKTVIHQNNKNKVLTDVAHLSEQGFWETIDVADYVIASHANAREICDHPRNLTNEQLVSLFRKQGQIHLVFYPPFIQKNEKEVAIDHLVHHIDHICSLGGERHLGFGSDFDGMDVFVKGLEHAGKYVAFIEQLLNYYTEEQVRGFAYQNFLRYIDSIPD